MTVQEMEKKGWIEVIQREEMLPLERNVLTIFSVFTIAILGVLHMLFHNLQHTLFAIIIFYFLMDRMRHNFITYLLPHN